MRLIIPQGAEKYKISSGIAKFVACFLKGY
jgi:hypothetical protein